MSEYSLQLGKFDEPSNNGTIYIRNVGIEPPLTATDKFILQDTAYDKHGVSLWKMHGHTVRPDDGVAYTEYCFGFDSFFDQTAEMADLQVRGLGALVTKILTDQGHQVHIDEDFKEIGTKIGEGPYLFNAENSQLPHPVA
jgi:hypothetical protein